jgi:hypothetical protein
VIGSRSPLVGRGWNGNGKSYGDLVMAESDISYISSGRHSVDRILTSGYDSLDPGGRILPRLSHSSDIDHNQGFESLHLGWRSLDATSPTEFSSRNSHDTDSLSNSPHSMVSSVELYVCVCVFQTPKYVKM